MFDMWRRYVLTIILRKEQQRIILKIDKVLPNLDAQTLFRHSHSSIRCTLDALRRGEHTNHNYRECPLRGVKAVDRLLEELFDGTMRCYCYFERKSTLGLNHHLLIKSKFIPITQRLTPVPLVPTGQPALGATKMGLITIATKCSVISANWPSP
jgi:hypothetical protein